jgi:hypothetical protein
LAQEVAQKPKPRPPLVQDSGAKLGDARPHPRPNLANTAAAAPLDPSPETTAELPRPTGLQRSPRPQPRPQFIAKAVEPALGQTQTDAPKQGLLQRLFGNASQGSAAKGAPSSAPRNGSVCGDKSIRGEAIGDVTSKVKGCGITDAVRVSEVAGIRLSQPAVVECGTVLALKDWIERAMRPAFGNRDVVQLRIAAHYVCRGRNNKRGARISEHGKGRALDISGFVFADGTEWSIRRDYNKQIRRAHRGACGIFGTTLGPGSDGYHEDHLHFDIARQRNGPYCR